MNNLFFLGLEICLNHVMIFSYSISELLISIFVKVSWLEIHYRKCSYKKLLYRKQLLNVTVHLAVLFSMIQTKIMNSIFKKLYLLISLNLKCHWPALLLFLLFKLKHVNLKCNYKIKHVPLMVKSLCNSMILSSTFTYFEMCLK